MADKTTNISTGLAAPWKDSRAEGYVTYYTKVGWDNWNNAAGEIERLVKEKQITYEQAMKLYAEQIKAIRAERDMLEKKLIDVGAKKADVLTRREEMKAKMEEARKLREQALETEKARRKAYRSGSSTTGSTYGSTGPMGKDPYDELLDEIPPATRKGMDSRLADISRGITSANLEQKFNALQTEYDNGNIASDALTRDMATYTLYKNAIAALEASGKSSTDAELEVNSLMLRKPSMNAQVGSAKARLAGKEAAGDKKYSRTTIGGYQGDYEIAQIQGGVADLTKTVDEYDTLEKDIKSKIEANAGLKVEKPVLEPVDMITAARKEYIKKYGNVPAGVTLKAGGETIAQYKDLMPFEVTNALGSVTDMFGRYVNAEIEAAKSAAGGRALTTDEVNRATEEGKRKARTVLFGQSGVYTPEEAAKVDAGKSPAGPTTTPVPTSAEGWASVGVTKPSTGNASADEASYQKAKEDWAAKRGITPQDISAVKERIAKYNREVLPDAAMEKQQRDMREARDAGILPYDIPEGAPLPKADLQAPPRTPSEYENFFRNRVAPPAPVAESPNVDIRGMLEEQRRRILSDDLRKRSMEGERRAPSFEVKPEGQIGPVPASIAPPPRSFGDILLRGFKPELDRRTGELIMPNITPQQYQDAVVGMTSGAQQAQLFPESMTAAYPRTTSEGVAARPLAVGELKPTLNKLDRAALGIPDTVGTPVGSEVLGGDMGGAQRKKEELKDKLDSFKSRQEFLKKAGEIGKPPEGASLERTDKKAKTEAVLAGATKAMENPAAAARDITKDSLGKYIASVYDENKIKGDRAKPISDLTQTVISEYAGDAERQKKAVALLTQLAYLDETKNKIKA